MHRGFALAAALIYALPALAQSSPAQALTPAGPKSLARVNVLASMRKVADYQLAHLNPKPDNNWIRATLFTGVLAAYRATGDARYLDRTLRWAREEGNFTPGGDQRFADNLCCGQVYCELYGITRDGRMVAPIHAAVDRQIATRKPGRVDWWWCDSLYMAPPMLARLADVTGEHKYIDFLNDMYWDSTDYLFDPAESLYYRDKNYFDKRTGAGRKVFWSRGNGWVMGGLARVLQYLPKDDPGYPRFVKHFRAMAARIATLQGADGLWRSSLLDAVQFPSPETSGTGFFTFSLAWGVNNGILDRKTFLPVAQKGWRGLVGAVSPEGRLGWVQQVAGSPGSVKPDGTQEYAVGAFLLAGAEMARLAE